MEFFAGVCYNGLKIALQNKNSMGKAVDFRNIKVEYRDTPERFHEAADEVIVYLIKNMLALNTTEEVCSQLMNINKRNFASKINQGIWTLYKARYGEALSAFCTEKN